ncbi:MAG: hypothetical protein HOV80_29740 [Polyangiaceae bacterium]|nr:hypothetical protein [Polyangiaceae bacterium]
MSFLRFACAGTAAFALALVSDSAFAQDQSDEDDSGWFEEDPEQETAEPTEAEPTEAPATSETPAIAVDPAEEPTKKPKAAATAKPPERPGNQTRFRWGISPFAGVAKYRESGRDEFRNSEDFAMGLETRFGGQLDDTLALYAVPSLIGSDTLRIATGLVIEATLADAISLGAGMDGLAGTDDDWEGIQPGIGAQARLGLHFGKLRPSRRKMFSAYFVTKADYYFDDSAVLMMGGMLGYDAM